MKKTMGFTMIELLIVVVIIGILTAISLPSWLSSVQRSHRTDAHASLLNMASQQERAAAQSNTYFEVTDGIDSAEGYYTLTVDNTPCGDFAICYTIRAAGVGGQANDTGCGTISYDSAGAKSPVDCW